ncbi:MAG TPA: ribosomal protein S18-alanine N-acetyltransferase [Clostridia bacterium]
MTTEHIDDVLIVERLSFRIPWSKASFIDELKNGLSVYIIARVNGKIAGYAGMWKVVDEGHITNIAVHPEYRRNGIGSALLEKLIEFSVSQNIKRMTLEVRKSNMYARKLYEKYGFLDGGFRKAYYADNNEDAVIMWKECIDR